MYAKRIQLIQLVVHYNLLSMTFMQYGYEKRNLPIIFEERNKQGAKVYETTGICKGWHYSKM